MGKIKDYVSSAVVAGIKLLGSSVDASGTTENYNIDDIATYVGNNIGLDLTVTKTLTPAETLALGSTPIELVAAPGAGKYIRITRYSIKFVPGATPYANSGSSTLVFNFGTDSVFTTISIIGETLSKVFFGFGDNVTTGVADNLALEISAKEGASMSAGDGYIIVNASYVIEDF